MPRWEYRAIQLNATPPRSEDIDVLNDAGEEGWELIGITTDYIAYLKRQRACQSVRLHEDKNNNFGGS